LGLVIIHRVPCITGRVSGRDRAVEVIMLSRQDNELLTRTGSGTPMGDLIRRYWIPVVLASELSPGGRAKRVELLGERLIAFRTPSGAPGLIGEVCPHRAASLYWGRVEESGVRCVYHG